MENEMWSFPDLCVITGPMFAGKTEELIRRLGRFEHANIEVAIFKPNRDTRVGEEVRSRNGKALQAVSVARAKDMLDLVEGAEVVGIDEGHFFDQDIYDTVTELMRRGKSVYICGLDTDSVARPFEHMASLMALANKVIKLRAVCPKCKQLTACRTQRMGDMAARYVVGDKEYEPRCARHFEY
jgi:thymidine kinase